MDKKRPIKKLKSNNKGASLLAVIMAMLLLSVLGMLLLSTGYMTYTMKTNAASGKKALYKVEGMLNQVCMGLNLAASQAQNEAENYVLTRYSFIDVAEQETLLRKKYVEFFEIDISGELGIYDSGRYKKLNQNSRELILNAENKKNLVKWLNSGRKKDSRGKIKLNDDMNIIFTEESENKNQAYSVLLRNITMEYTLRDGSSAEITTDIRMSPVSSKNTGESVLLTFENWRRT